MRYAREVAPGGLEVTEAPCSRRRSESGYSVVSAAATPGTRGLVVAEAYLTAVVIAAALLHRSIEEAWRRRFYAAAQRLASRWAAPARSASGNPDAGNACPSG